MANPFITLGGAIGGALDNYRWLADLDLKKKAQASDERYRMLMAQNESDRTAMEGDRYARDNEERAQARQEAKALKDEQDFNKFTIPRYTPGAQVTPADLSNFQRYGSPLIAQNPTDDPNTTTGYTFLGTPEQRRRKSAIDELAGNPQAQQILALQDAGLTGAEINAYLQNQNKPTPQQKAQEAGLITDAQERARAKYRHVPNPKTPTDPDELAAERAYNTAYSAYLRDHPEDENPSYNAAQAADDAREAVLNVRRSRRGAAFLDQSMTPGATGIFPPVTGDTTAKPAPPVPPKGFLSRAWESVFGDSSSNANPAPPTDATAASFQGATAAAPAGPKIAVGQLVTLRKVGKVRVTAVHPDGTFDYDTVR